MQILAYVRRLSVALIVVFGAFSPTNAAALDRVPFDLESVRTAQANGDRFIIGAWATWCATCQAQIEVLNALEDDPRFADITIFHIDYDHQKPMMRLFHIGTRSQIVAFRGETELGRLISIVDPLEIEALMVMLTED